MKFKFCMLTRFDHRSFGLVSLLGFFLLATGSHELVAQSPSPSPAKKPKSFVRFWNLTTGASTTLEVLVGSPGPQDPPFLAGSPSNFYADYRPLPPSTYSVKICKSGDRNAIIKEFSLPLRDGMSLTIIAQDKDGRIAVEASDDTYDPAKTDSGKLTVRNYFPNGKVVITVDGKVKTDPLSPGEVAHLDGLPLKAASLMMTATIPNGQILHSSSGVDFAATPHATLLVLADAYGRFRPRVAIDGQPPKIDDDATQNTPNGKPKP